ncbi:MAG TPA: DUF1559 domain-containing protein, partial [Gemmataceae bacterium]|nr:DUF1559 domain-containing protein [Gemmataceae bacterium]
MKPRYGLALGWLVLASVCVCTTNEPPVAAQQKKSLKTRLKSAMKGRPAWTIDEAMAQLHLSPKDPYLQYVALQLARREQRADEIGAHIEQLLGNEARQQRMERASRADLFNIFSGALAVQESLQLDTMRGQGSRPLPRDGRMPPVNQPEGTKEAAPSPKGTQKDPVQLERERRALRLKQHINIADLAGPTIKSHPWEEMLRGKKPEISPLARFVPEEFYFAEFHSLNKLLEALDVSDLWGRHLFNQATQEARTQLAGERLKAQLAVETNRLLRPVYDLVVEEVAVAGSDLFLAEGSDVSLLFRFKQPDVFKARMDGFLAHAEKAHPDVRRQQGEYLGIEYTHLSTPDRALHVYSAYPAPGLHLRSNSQVAFRRILEVIQGKPANGGPVRSLGNTSEFAYIRTLLPRGAKEEDGFIYLSDPFVRRMVGPQVKLTERRRMLCYNHLRMIGHAALLFRTEHGRAPQSLEELAEAQCSPGVFGRGRLACPDGGSYSLSADGLAGVCAHHGRAHNLTPCCEVAVAQVDGEEADEYKEFLREYNQYWRTFFDPIALRIQITPQRYRLETIVLPLIDNSIYTGLAHALGGKAEPLDALPVPKRNIFSVALKLNKEDLLAEAGLIQPAQGAASPERPGDPRRTPTAADTKCANNLKQLGLALHNYHDTYGRFPAVANFDKDGKPLLSWRVHLLPFLDEGQLYREFHLNEPWDSAHNKKLVSRLP